MVVRFFHNAKKRTLAAKKRQEEQNDKTIFEGNVDLPQLAASLGRGISTNTLDRYTGFVSGYINPTVIEERKLNATSIDVFILAACFWQ